MTDRRAFIVGGVAAFAAPLVAAAQQPTKVWKIGHLGVSQRMRQFGYVEGQNLVFEERYSDGDIERFPALEGYRFQSYQSTSHSWRRAA